MMLLLSFLETEASVVALTVAKLQELFVEFMTELPEKLRQSINFDDPKTA